MTHSVLDRRRRRALALSLGLHLAILLSWPIGATEALDATQETAVELTLIERPPEAPEPEPPAEPEVATVEQDAAQAPEPTAPRPESVAFVYADVPDVDEPDGSTAEVISAVTDDSELALAAAIDAPEAGQQAPQDVAAPASPTSIAVAAAAGELTRAQTAAPKPVEATVAQQGDPTDGIDAPEVAQAPSGELALDGGTTAPSEPEVAPVEASLWDEAGSDEVAVAEGFNGLVDKPIVEDPSIDVRGASGSEGGSATSSQAVIDDAKVALRSRLRRANTPLGRYTQRVYSVVRKRWHKHRVELMPIEREVTVAFRIERGGTVELVELEQSSGDPLLDAIARASVPRRLARFPAELQQSHIRQEITFRYVP